MIKYILRKFGYVLVKKKTYDELIFDDSLVFETEEYMNKRRERLIQEVTRELFVRHYAFNEDPNGYLICRNAAERLANMEAINWTK